MDVMFICHTGGDGLWTNVSAIAVQCTALAADSSIVVTGGDTIENEYGELQVRFDVNTWNIEANGLIYTDKTWQRELRANLCALGFSQAAADDIEYSEAGMQGEDFVSFDVSHAFLKEFRQISKEEVKPVEM